VHGRAKPIATPVFSPILARTAKGGSTSHTIRFELRACLAISGHLMLAMSRQEELLRNRSGGVGKLGGVCQDKDRLASGYRESGACYQGPGGRAYDATIGVAYGGLASSRGRQSCRVWGGGGVENIAGLGALGVLWHDWMEGRAMGHQGS